MLAATPKVFETLAGYLAGLRPAGTWRLSTLECTEYY
jgi:hypothetical protein